jgi:hypothetical protein
MQTAPPGRLPGARREPEALIREARRHQRRRWLAAGTALLMVSAGAAAVIAGSGAPCRRHGEACAVGDERGAHAGGQRRAALPHWPAPGLVLAGDRPD